MSKTTHSNRKPNDMERKQNMQPDPYDIDTCTSDPAWAEHARPNDEGPEPCDDGRGIQFEKH